MVLEPLYAENIIVAVIYNKKFKWYVTDKELCFLDYNKLDNAYEALGISVEYEYEEYVPEGWKGKYEDFTELIPESQKYWIDEFNNNLFLK